MESTLTVGKYNIIKTVYSKIEWIVCFGIKAHTHFIAYHVVTSATLWRFIDCHVIIIVIIIIIIIVISQRLKSKLKLKQMQEYFILGGLWAKVPNTVTAL